MRKILAAAGAAALITAPLTAGPAPLARSSAPAEDASDIGARSSLLFIAGIAVVAAAVLLLSVDEDDEPVSA